MDDRSISDNWPKPIMIFLFMTGLIIYVFIIDFILSIPEMLNEWTYTWKHETRKKWDEKYRDECDTL